VTPDNKNNDPLDAILRHAMRAQPGPATPECADAESLAAYSDRTLAAPDRERLETHFADCMRCQLILADVARADESARLAKAASVIPWYRRWAIAIPALAAVAAVLVFVSIRPPANEHPENDQLVAMAKREAPAMDLAARESAPAPAVVLGSPPPAQAPRVAPSAPNEIALNEEKSDKAPRAEAMNAEAPRELHKQVAASAAGAMAAQAGAPERVVPAAPLADSRGFVARSLSARSSASLEILASIAPPDRSVNWIAGKNGMLQRRDPDGAMHVQRSGVSTDLLAGSAPSATVCWIVGRSGTIIRTNDGDHWQLITSPTTDNLTAVSADNANDATITTADHRMFATSDGGASWHPANP
jgi:hypothetical protein